MAKGSTNGVVLGHLRTLFDGGAARDLSDEELLGRFLEDRGRSGEAAFEALVHRHGPLVFGVCRRTLGDVDQAEDAFQATFLVLARKARSIRNREAVGPWLVGVAGKVAARARGDALRRRAHEGRAAEDAARRLEEEPGDGDEVAALLLEVGRLRRPLREAVTLCHLQGHTYDSAADALGVSEGAIRGRLARARELLRARLGRRGFDRDTASTIPLAPLLESAPARLVEPTVRGSMAVAAGRAASGIVSASAITLMKGALKSMLLAKLRTIALVALAMGAIGLGISYRAHALPAPQAPKDADPKSLASAVDGHIIQSSEVTKDCMILSYMPDWNFGNVDNIGIGNSSGGNRTLVAWPDVPASKAKSDRLKFYLAFYSRKTTANDRPGAILAFELIDDWGERTSWKVLPPYEPEPVLTAKFEPGEGWKVFDVTKFVQERAGRPVKGLMFRFLCEDRSGGSTLSGYEFVSREAKGEWLDRRPKFLVVETNGK